MTTSSDQFIRQWMAEHPPKQPASKNKRRTKAMLEGEMETQRKAFEAQIKKLQTQIEHADTGRVAAQRGLVPYVRSLEQFHVWLTEHPALAAQVATKMQELRIWDIKLGYDPTRDVKTSLVSPERMARVRPEG